jgi:hypothetical protein
LVAVSVVACAQAEYSFRSLNLSFIATLSVQPTYLPRTTKEVGMNLRTLQSVYSWSEPLTLTGLPPKDPSDDDEDDEDEGDEDEQDEPDIREPDE